MIHLKKLIQFDIHNTRIQALLLLMLWLPYFFNSWAYSIWDSNEAYYVEGPKEMLGASDLMSPRFNYDFRFEKPVLSYWVVILFYKIFGINVFTERLAINLFALGSILLTYLLARVICVSKNKIETGESSTESYTQSLIPFFSAIIFATSFKYFTLAHRSIIDILLTFWVLLSLYCYIVFIRLHHASYLAYYGIFVCCGMGVLSKGLLGIVVPGGIIFFHLIISRRLYLIKELKFFLGIILFLIIALPWYIYMAFVHGSDYLKFFIIGNHFQLYMKGFYSLARPFWYYMPNITGGFAPWSCFVIIIAYCLYFNYRNKDYHTDKIGFLIIWIAFIFVFFSFSRGKQEEYVLQIYPALSILLAWAIDYYQDLPVSRWSKRFTSITVSLISIAFLLSGASMFLLNRIIFPECDYISIFPIIFILFSIFSILIFTTSTLKRFFFAAASFTWLLYVILIAFYLPMFDKEYKYVQFFANEYKKVSSPGDQIGYFKVGIPSLCYYTNQKIHIFMSTKEISNIMETHKLYLIIDKNNFDNLDTSLKNNFQILHTRKEFPTTSKNFIKLAKGYGIEEVLLLVSK